MNAPQSNSSLQSGGTIRSDAAWERTALRAGWVNLFASPLSISEYIAGLVITSIMTSFIGVVVMLVLATGVFHLQFFSLGASLVAFLMVLFVFGITLGIFASAIVLRLVAHALPPGYVFEGMRNLLHGDGFPAALLMQGAAVAAAELLLAAYYYGRVYRHAVRTGLLARYSAESAA
jgi:ABC-2 type transport system permease protein